MEYNATTRDEYLKGMKALGDVPIIGTHRIGNVVITVGHQSYLVVHHSGTKKYLLTKGRTGIGHTARYKVNVALREFIRAQFP